jgi:hypothetical protein
MKTTLISSLAITLFCFTGFLTENANAQNPQNKTEKIIIKSSDGGSMAIDKLRDTIIISNDGKDTTIIKTTQDGKEKKVTVRKVITSGNDKDDMHWVEAETELNDVGGDHVIVEKSESGEPHTIRIEKRITKEDGSDSVVIKEIRHKELPEGEDISFDEHTGGKHKTITIITGDGKEKEIETNGDGQTIIIYINDDDDDHHHKTKKQGKHEKTYVIEEEKSIKK